MSFNVPYVGTVHLMAFQREGDPLKVNENRTASQNANSGTTGSKLNKTAGHEVPYASTKQGGKYAYREITDATENSDHGTALQMFYDEHNLKDGQWFIVPMVETSSGSKPRPFLTLLRMAIGAQKTSSDENQNNTSLKNSAQAKVVPILKIPVPDEIPARAASTSQPAPAVAPAGQKNPGREWWERIPIFFKLPVLLPPILDIPGLYDNNQSEAPRVMM